MTNSRLLYFGNSVRLDLYQDVFHMLGFIISVPPCILFGICTKDKKSTNLTHWQSIQRTLHRKLPSSRYRQHKQNFGNSGSKGRKNMVEMARTLTTYCLKTIFFSFPIWNFGRFWYFWGIYFSLINIQVIG